MKRAGRYGQGRHLFEADGVPCAEKRTTRVHGPRGPITPILRLWRGVPFLPGLILGGTRARGRKRRERIGLQATRGGGEARWESRSGRGFHRWRIAAALPGQVPPSRMCRLL